MGKRSEKSRLAFEPREAFGIRGELRGKSLDSDLASKTRVARTIDLAHAAFAEQADDFIVAQGLADHEILLKEGMLLHEQRVAHTKEIHQES
jgi:hypothetical protein